MADQKKQGNTGGKQQPTGYRGTGSQPPAAVSETSKVISSIGKKVIGLGILILAIGFFILSKTDPQGQNWASMLSPFLIVGAYVLIAIGILLPERK